MPPYPASLYSFHTTSNWHGFSVDRVLTEEEPTIPFYPYFPRPFEIIDDAEFVEIIDNELVFDFYNTELEQGFGGRMPPYPASLYPFHTILNWQGFPVDRVLTEEEPATPFYPYFPRPFGLGFPYASFEGPRSNYRGAEIIDDDEFVEIIDDELVFDFYNTELEQGFGGSAEICHSKIGNLERIIYDGTTKYEQKECSICLGELLGCEGSGEKLGRMPCDHLFHYGCIVEWLRHSWVCPLCRCTVD